jgi:hypothetical protein
MMHNEHVALAKGTVTGTSKTVVVMAIEATGSVQSVCVLVVCNLRYFADREYTTVQTYC